MMAALREGGTIEYVKKASSVADPRHRQEGQVSVGRIHRYRVECCLMSLRFPSTDRKEEQPAKPG